MPAFTYSGGTPLESEIVENALATQVGISNHGNSGTHFHNYNNELRLDGQVLVNVTQGHWHCIEAVYSNYINIPGLKRLIFVLDVPVNTSYQLSQIKYIYYTPDHYSSCYLVTIWSVLGNTAATVTQRLASRQIDLAVQAAAAAAAAVPAAAAAAALPPVVASQQVAPQRPSRRAARAAQDKAALHK